jgi:hypothetical protein
MAIIRWPIWPFLAVCCNASFDSKERAKFSGLAKKLTSVIIVKNLALMLDALEELSDLSLGLQKGDITFMKADRWGVLYG